MATGTTNPPGSTDPRDLYANAQNLDLLLTGPQPFYPDRLNAQRYSWRGMESDFSTAQSGRQIAFQQFLAASGFEAPISYAAGVTLQRATQTFVRENIQYRIKNPSDLPYTLTGNWANESEKFVSMGDSGLRQELASVSGSDKVGTSLKSGEQGTVTQAIQENRSDILATQKLLKTVDGLHLAAQYGGSMLVADGVYQLEKPLEVDYRTLRPDDLGTGFPGYLSKRYNLAGQSQGSTVFLSPPSDYSVKLIGQFESQSVNGLDYLGNLTISNPIRNIANTDNSGGSGVLIEQKAFTKIERLFLQNLAVGMKLDSVLTSSVTDVTAQGCYQGLIMTNSGGFSGPNAMRMARVRVANSTSNGIVADVGSAAHFENLVVEGCGSQGTVSCGMTLTCQPDQIGGNVTFTEPYFELNAGEADIYINNASTHPLVVTINGGLFARAGEKWTKNNIHAHSDGGGPVLVILKGVTFLSVAGYPADQNRPFWIADANCTIVADESCIFNEVVSLPARGRKFSKVRALTIGSAGNILAGDSQGISISNPNPGVYVFTTTGFFGADALSYSVTANGCDSEVTGTGSIAYARVQPISGGQFAVNCYGANGSPVSGPLTLQIASLRGGI